MITIEMLTTSTDVWDEDGATTHPIASRLRRATMPPERPRRSTELKSDTERPARSDSTVAANNLAAWLVSSVVRVPTRPVVDGAVTLQKWQGRVDEVTDNSFVATLADLNQRGAEEVAEFDLEEVSSQDRPLVIPGAIFYWSVGWRDAVSGQRSRESLLRFQRLPRWTPRDRSRAAERVAAWKRHLSWDD